MRSVSRVVLGVTAAILLCGPVSVAGAPRPELSSHWKARDITVDGMDDEWTDLTQSIEKPPIALGFVNDGDSLYVCIKASDRATRMQIMRQGLIVWFDPQGGDKKVFGIQYPVPEPMGRPPDGERGRPGSASGSGGEPGPGGPPLKEGQEQTLFREPPNRLEIYGPRKGDARTLVLDEARGISVRVGQAEGVLVYELKVALARQGDQSYGIGATPGATVGIGLVTPEMQQMQRPSGPGGGGPGGPGGGGRGGPGGGMGGPGGGMGGSGGGRMGGSGGGRGGPGGPGGGGRGSELPKPIKTWVKARLASER
jgi:hypothetical protein